MIKSVFASLVALIITIAPTNLTHAQTYSVLYSFDGVPEDGIGPSGTLVQDEAGNLYGIASQGAYQAGLVFKLTP